MKLSMEFEDGTVLDAQANPKTFIGLASKSAFKRQFGVPATVLSFWSEAFVEDADGEPDEDGKKPSHLNPDLTRSQLEHVDEEYMAFLVWLELKRRRDDVPEGEWGKVVESVVGITIDAEDAEDDGEDADPTKATST